MDFDQYARECVGGEVMLRQSASTSSYFAEERKSRKLATLGGIAATLFGIGIGAVVASAMSNIPGPADIESQFKQANLEYWNLHRYDPDDPDGYYRAHKRAYDAFLKSPNDPDAKFQMETMLRITKATEKARWEFVEKQDAERASGGHLGSRESNP